MMNMAMDNMTTDSMPMHHMHHTPHDMGHDTGHDTGHDMKHTSHIGYFHFSAEAVILFAGWTTVTWGGRPKSSSLSSSSPSSHNFAA